MYSSIRVGRFLFFMAVFAFAVSAQLLLAQTTGTIQGTVKDPSGAVLPGATVTVRNVETGQSRNATSGAAGEYRVPALSVGNYEVQASVSGFQTGIRKGVTLSVA